MSRQRSNKVRQSSNKKKNRAPQWGFWKVVFAGWCIRSLPRGIPALGFVVWTVIGIIVVSILF